MNKYIYEHIVKSSFSSKWWSKVNKKPQYKKLNDPLIYYRKNKFNEIHKMNKFDYTHSLLVYNREFKDEDKKTLQYKRDFSWCNL